MKQFLVLLAMTLLGLFIFNLIMGSDNSLLTLVKTFFTKMAVQFEGVIG